MLGEKAQTVACKEIAQIIIEEMNSIDFNPENAKDFNQETLFSQHLLVCALQEIGCLVLSLGTTAHDLITEQSLSELHLLVFVYFSCVCVCIFSRFDRIYGECVGSPLPSGSFGCRLLFTMHMRCCS